MCRLHLFTSHNSEQVSTTFRIFQIIKSIYTIAEFSSEARAAHGPAGRPAAAVTPARSARQCLVISLLYIERLCSTAKMALLRGTARPFMSMRWPQGHRATRFTEWAAERTDADTLGGKGAY